jgi:hypothetical protein
MERNSMPIKTILLSSLEQNLRTTLNECAESGDTVVVELPDHKFIALQSLEATSDDSLVDELIANNPAFREMVARSKSTPRKPFVAATDENG